MNENDENTCINNNLSNRENIKKNSISTEKTEEKKISNNNTTYVPNDNQNQKNYDSLNKKMDLFDKKLLDLESLLKEKIMKILVQMDKLQNTYFHPMNQKKKSVQKFNSVNLIMNSYGNKNYTNSNTAGNEYQNSNTKTHISHDDYFIHSHSVKRIAPIVEIDPNSLQFSPSPSRDQNKLLSNQKSRENKKK